MTPAQGAITQLWAGTENGIEEHSGAVRKRLASSGVIVDNIHTFLVSGPLGEVFRASKQ